MTAALLDEAEIGPLLLLHWELVARRVVPRHRAGRLKQWLNFLRRRFPWAQQIYDEWRQINDPRQLGELLHKRFGNLGSKQG